MPSILLLGGTGCVGQATAKVAKEQGYEVSASGLEDSAADDVDFIPLSELSLQKRTWDAIFDIYSHDELSARTTYELFKKRTDHFFVMSTTLVYDRSVLSYQRIASSHQKAKKGTQGGYVDNKLDVEDFWESVDDINWTILRPYHILSPHSYLGCLPPHNRDPHLIKTLLTGRIKLADGGRNPLNVVDAGDIGRTVLALMGKTSKKAYNVVNPKQVIAQDYYKTLARMIGVDLKIENLPGEKIWEKNEWTLTTLPHLYDVSDLEKDSAYLPNTSLEESLKKVFLHKNSSVEKKETDVHKRMHALPLPPKHKYFS